MIFFLMWTYSLYLLSSIFVCNFEHSGNWPQLCNVYIVYNVYTSMQFVNTLASGPNFSCSNSKESDIKKKMRDRYFPILLSLPRSATHFHNIFQVQVVKPNLLFDLAGNSFEELATLVASSFGIKRKFTNFKKIYHWMPMLFCFRLFWCQLSLLPAVKELPLPLS